jgi:hypothetical protein
VVPANWQLRRLAGPDRVVESSDQFERGAGVGQRDGQSRAILHRPAKAPELAHVPLWLRDKAGQGLLDPFGLLRRVAGE